MDHFRKSASRTAHWVTRIFGVATIMAPLSAAAGLFEDSVSGQSSSSSQAVGPVASSEEGVVENPADASAVSSDATAVSSPTVVERIIEKTGLSFDLNGHLRGDLFIGKTEGRSRAEIKNGYGELALKLKVSKYPYGDAFAEVRIQGGYLNNDHYLGQPSDTAAMGADLGEFDSKIKLREAYINAYIGSHFDLRFGYQIIVWGRADGINPTNNLTPIDMRVRSPEEDDRRLGNLALRAALNFSPVRIEGIWVPFYASSYISKINLADSIVFDDPKYPDMDISNGTYAAKIHLLLPQIEMSASYLYGYSLQPCLSHVSNNLLDEGRDASADPAAVTVARTAYQHHVVGFDFSTVVAGMFGLRGELAFKYPLDYEKQSAPFMDDIDEKVAVPNPELSYVLGIDKEFGNVSLIAQYIGKYIFKWEKVADSPVEVDLDNLDETLDNAGAFANEAGVAFMIHRELTLKNRIIQGQTEKVQHGVSGRIEWKTLHDTLSLIAFSMVNVSTKEWLLYPKIKYSITDAMEVTLGAEIYQGPKDSLFGYVEEILTAGYTELKIAF